MIQRRVLRMTSTSSDTTEEDVDHWSEYRNPNNKRDQVFSAISKQGGIKITAVTARNIMNDLMIQHHLSSVSADALGRTIMCSLLMANGIQDEQIVQISLKTTGPIRGVVAVCNGLGHVRGYVGSPQLGEDLSLQEAVGMGGAVQIVKNHPDWPRPYNGITALEHGDVDRDIGRYLANSEQRSCALAAATSILPGGLLCNAAGAYLIEQLPDVTEEEQELVERNLEKLVQMDGGATLPTNLLLKSKTPLDIALVILEDLGMQATSQVEPTLKCDCTEDRLLRALRLLPTEEVEEILEKEDKIEARCEFCGEVYRMGPEEVREKLAATGSEDEPNQ